MDPEQTFLRVHARLSGMLSQLLTPRIRMALEYAYLAVAISLLAVLVVMHTNFVQQPGCSSELSGIELSDAQLVRIKITGAGLWTRSSFGLNTMEAQGVVTETSKGPELHGDGLAVLSAKFWSHWLGLGARRGKLSLKSWRTDKEYLEPQVEKLPESTISKPYEADTNSEFEVQHDGRPSSLKGALKAAFHHLYSNWNMPIMSFWSNTKEFFSFVNQMWKRAGWNVFADAVKSLRLLRWEYFKSSVVKWLEKRSQSFEPTYLYTVEKGYFLLPEGAKSQHSIRTVNITISAQNSCFGNRWQQLLINSFVGYDTILMNSLLDSPGHGYLYNYQTKEFYDLSYGQELPEGSARFGDYFVTKCGVLLMSLFVFFTTTMSVSFTLRETQSRMLKFTVQLQHHARNHLPTFQLIFVHVIESLVFVPIMIGILFFLFEFYDDQILAFLVLTLVWLCELFTMISVRTAISMQFFPRFFLLYFLVFHIYFFSYRYGFSYLAFSTTAAFMLHLILYFWNRFEVPALHRFMRTRAQLQQQTGVHFTSSTFYASTLHIARLSMANANVVVNEPTIRTETLSRVNARRGSDITGQFQGSGSQDGSNLNPQRAGVSGSSTMSNIGSLLLWLLGGTSEGIGSFFSTPRDVRDQVAQIHAEQNQEVNASR